MSADPRPPLPFKPRVRAVDLGGRVPPHNGEAEAAVLSTILCRASAFDEVADIVGPGDYYSDANRRIFEAAIDLRARGVPLDVVTIAAELKARDRLQAVGGVAYLNTIVDATPAVAHVSAHAKIVRGHAKIRRLIEEAQLVAAEAYLGDFETPDAFLADAEARIFNATRSDGSTDAVDLRDYVAREEERLAQIEAGQITGGGLSTGFRDLDALLGGGLYDGEYTILAARPGMGKTALIGAVSTRIARVNHDGVTLAVLIVSIEAPGESLARRMAASEGGINLTKLRKGHLTPKERTRLTDAHVVLQSLPISIDPSPIVTPTSLRARVRRAMAKCESKGMKLGLVVIDYVQRMKPDAYEKGRSRDRELGEISTAIAENAKGTGVPHLVCCQLNREVDKRHGKDCRPRMADLRECGQLEADAHNIIALHRPEAYVADKDDVAAEDKGLAEAIVLKNREGATGVARLHFVGWCTRFQDFQSGPIDQQSEDM